MNLKTVIKYAKILIGVVILVGITFAIKNQWHEIQSKASKANFTLTPFGTLIYSGVVLSSGTVWFWLTRRLHDRSPFLPMLSAYTYSQMGKYFPGKVALLLMRLERTNRYGMTLQTCTISTLLENALYIVSGALVGLLGLFWHLHDLLSDRQGTLILIFTTISTLVLMACCHPKIFYGLFNLGLKKMKKPTIPPQEQLTMASLGLAILMFLPCWIFGGTALWVATYCVNSNVPLASLPVFISGFALSVILGMLSFIPSGFGLRDLVLGMFVIWEFRGIVTDAPAIATVAVVLLRLFQISAELIVGLLGAALSRGPQKQPA